MNENNRPDFENENTFSDEPLFEGKLRREAAQHRSAQTPAQGMESAAETAGAPENPRPRQMRRPTQGTPPTDPAHNMRRPSAAPGSTPGQTPASRPASGAAAQQGRPAPQRRPAPGAAASAKQSAPGTASPQHQQAQRPAVPQSHPATGEPGQASPTAPRTRPAASPDAAASRPRPAASSASGSVSGSAEHSPRPRPVRPAAQRGAVVPSKGAQVTPKKAPGAPVPAPEAEKPAAAAGAAVPAYAARRSRAVTDTGSGGNSKPGEKAKKVSTRHENTKEGANMMTSVVKGIVYIVLVLVVSVFISIFAIRVGNDVFAFVKSDEAVDITIPENATTSEVARILADNGIIKYPSVFKMYASLKHEKGDYLAGDYTVSPSMSYDKLRGTFKKQVETGTCWITIPEGYTTDEIIDLMVENGIGTREGYIDVINNYDFDYWFIDELEEKGTSPDRFYRLDGYLFPDSYEFYKASSEATVINKLMARFDEVFVEDYRTRASQLGYSVDQILTIASLVEKEAGSMADFMYVSSVFNNRLKDPYNFPRLESDATVVYAIQINTGVRPKEITPEDLKYDSPYNTYTHEGLPPGPITNPSASAIRYALYPANTNYKYFVSADNGTTLFAATKYEHDANIQTVKQMNEQK